MKRFIVFCIVALLALPAMAAVPHVGQALSTLQNIEIFAKPPEKKFLRIEGPGAQTTNLPANTQVTVRDIKTITTALRDDIWIRLDQGWAYYGTATESSNFR